MCCFTMYRCDVLARFLWRERELCGEEEEEEDGERGERDIQESQRGRERESNSIDKLNCYMVIIIEKKEHLYNTSTKM